MYRLILLVPSLAAAASPHVAEADVVASAPHGFSLEIQTVCAAPRQRVYRALLQEIGKWWDPAHTYSGKSSNLAIQADQGWFVEKLPAGGFVRHLQIASVQPNKSIRMLGGLGPLQELGVQGALTIKLRTVADNNTEVKLLYNVSGFLRGGVDKLAPPVDRVLASQVQRLKDYVQRPADEGDVPTSRSR